MSYVRCIKNQGFIWQNGQRVDEEIIGLTVGRIYKTLPTEAAAQEHGMIRVIDESAEDYLYPAAYFEPVEVGRDHEKRATISAHVPDWMAGVLYAEAVAADKPISTLLRELIAERFDLPNGD
jgi:hypothetical protein